MKYILQIHTGPWDVAAYQPEDIIRKIEDILPRVPVGKVIIGWNTNASVYRNVGAFLRGAGIQMLLWLPIFAEVSAMAESDGSRDLFGGKIGGSVRQEGDDFDFGCPSSPHNLQIVKDIFEKHFAGCGFDGVFLDRIRSQSFLAGVPGVLSCGCERCRKAFLRKGVDISEVRKVYEEKRDHFFDMSSWPMNGAFILRNQTAQRFFEAREEIVAEGVTDLCRYFRSKGLTVGLDLFAPLVSRFVGQNYALITKDADFIKPMLYRKTEAPAGIGYEYALFRKYAPDALGRPEVSMNRSFLDTQLEAVRQVDCEKYPGIEINYANGIAETDPGYIKESLAAVRDHGFEGAALCWNIMQAPDAHIGAATEAARG